jgi:hypothetical protein
MVFVRLAAQASSRALVCIICGLGEVMKKPCSRGGALLAAGLSLGQDVRYNFDKNTDFSKLKTYKWVTIKDAAQVNDITDKQIIAAVDAELAAKGLTKVGDDSANLYIG